ncbi:MAG: hypothetical protein KJZ75_13975 [Hyphomonadaceae bacterium]|nr:hypothetical protein [Hyphomonadaceae bacterium]
MADVQEDDDPRFVAFLDEMEDLALRDEAGEEEAHAIVEEQDEAGGFDSALLVAWRRRWGARQRALAVVATNKGF